MTDCLFRWKIASVITAYWQWLWKAAPFWPNRVCSQGILLTHCCRLMCLICSLISDCWLLEWDYELYQCSLCAIYSCVCNTGNKIPRREPSLFWPRANISCWVMCCTSGGKDDSWQSCCWQSQREPKTTMDARIKFGRGCLRFANVIVSKWRAWWKARGATRAHWWDDQKLRRDLYHML